MMDNRREIIHISGIPENLSESPNARHTSFGPFGTTSSHFEICAVEQGRLEEEGGEEDFKGIL